MLWENSFYTDGEEIGDALYKAVSGVAPEQARDCAIEARSKMNLRHAPLLVVRAMAKSEKHKHLVAETLKQVIQRADELAEFLSIYWKNGKEKLSAQVKKGLAKAFRKFSEYQLAKYNRDGAVKLRDVLFLCHAKPKDIEQDHLWKKLIGGYCENCWKPISVRKKSKMKACRCKNQKEARRVVSVIAIWCWFSSLPSSARSAAAIQVLVAGLPSPMVVWACTISGGIIGMILYNICL